MNLNDAIILGQTSLASFQERGELAGWSFHIDTGTKSRRLGCCRYRRKQISVSRWYAELNDEILIRDTILHELAHALAFERYGETGHGRHWRRTCVEIGAKPNRVKYGVKVLELKLKATCPDCGKVHYRHVTPRQRRFCICQMWVKSTGLMKPLIWESNSSAISKIAEMAAQRIYDGGDTRNLTGESVEFWIKQLSTCRDKSEAKRIRARLRRLGHRGGLS